MSRRAVVAICLMLQPGCDWLSDPAVRLAYCVERAAREHPRDGTATHVSCDLKMPGSYVVVLHPEGALRDQRLVSAGLPQALLPELGVLRLGEQPAIYVIATDPGVSGTGSSRSIRSSWTTYQMKFVLIDSLMVLAKTTQPVRVDIAGPAERPVIEGVH
jgi:hypothetical protein